MDPLASDAEYLAYLQVELDAEKSVFLKRDRTFVASMSDGRGLHVGEGFNLDMHPDPLRPHTF